MYKEVNCTEPPASVRVPGLIYLDLFKGEFMGRPVDHHLGPASASQGKAKSERNYNIINFFFEKLFMTVLPYFLR